VDVIIWAVVQREKMEGGRGASGKGEEEGRGEGGEGGGEDRTGEERR
jgi:hypothetical protein